MTFLVLDIVVMVVADIVVVPDVVVIVVPPLGIVEAAPFRLRLRLILKKICKQLQIYS